jgi:hypothetical protein
MGTEDFHATVDLWERDIVYDDHLARFSLGITCECDRTVSQGCCYTPRCTNIYTSPQWVDSMGGGYGYIDELTGGTNGPGVTTLAGKTAIKAAWWGHAAEGQATWQRDIGAIVGTAVGGAVGTVCSGPVGGCLGAISIGTFGYALGTWTGQGFGGGFVLFTMFSCDCSGNIRHGERLETNTYGDDELYWTTN